MRFAILLMVPAAFVLNAEPVCHKCEIIRKYNAEHPSQYVYYEDYLKDQGAKKDQEIEFQEDKKGEEAK